MKRSALPLVRGVYVSGRLRPPYLLHDRDGIYGHRTMRGRLSHIPGATRPQQRERPRDQPPVPTQDRVRRHDGRNLSQNLATESLALHRQAAALAVSQPDTPPPQLLPKDAVLLNQMRGSKAAAARVRNRPSSADPTSLLRGHPPASEAAQYSDTTVPLQAYS